MARSKSSKSSAPSPSAEMDKPYVRPIERKNGPWDDYDIREALRTLVDADKIRANSGLMRRVKAEAKKQAEAARATSASINR